LPRNSSLQRLKEVFDSEEYWEGVDGRPTIGYFKYQDFPVHGNTIRLILKENPKSVLDVGGGYGYIVRRLNQFGVYSVNVEISNYCIKRRATNSFIQASATHLPFKDKAFDLVISIATLEHIPESRVDEAISEIVRVGRRGLMGISFKSLPNDVDITHVNMKPFKYWRGKFPREFKVLEKEETEIERFEAVTSGFKLNVGSHVLMFSGWINIDVVDLEGYAHSKGFTFLRHDVKAGLPFEDESCSIINASHFLEHLTYEEALDFLKECYRVLGRG